MSIPVERFVLRPFCFFLLVSAAVSVGMSATLRVPNDYATIQLAVTAAQAGDTIRIFAGTYTGHLNINKSLVMIGSGPDTATVVQAPTDYATNTAYDYSLTNFNTERTIVHIGPSSAIKVVLRGLKIDGATRGPSFYKVGTEVVPYSGILAEQCTLLVDRSVVTNILPADGTSIWDSTKVNNGRGIHARGSGAVVSVTNCQLSQINRFYILVNASESTSSLPAVFPTASVIGNTLTGKGSYKGGQKGIWFNIGAWGTIQGNTLTDFDYPTATVEPERASGIVLRYAYLNTSNGTMIRSNTLTAATSVNNKGIYAQGIGDSVIDNVVTGYRFGIELHDAQNAVVARDTITGGTMGVLIGTELGPRSDAITVGGSPANKNVITGQPTPAQGGYAIALSYRDPAGDQFLSTVPVDARFNDFGTYTGDSVAAKIFDRADTTVSPAVDTVLAYPFYAPGVRANLKVFLEGATSADSMLNTLRGSIYMGQHFGSIPIPALAVDSINIEIRDARTAAGSTIRQFSPAWLLTDGTIRGFSDTTKSFVQYAAVPVGMYHLVVRHRNHLAIISDTSKALEFGSAPTAFDFTTAMNKAYGTNPMKLVGTKYTMYAGNGNGDGSINATDRNLVWRVQNGTQGYLNGDFNLNGVANATDRNLLWRLNNGIASQVP